MQHFDSQRVAKSLIFALFPAKKFFVENFARRMLNRRVKMSRNVMGFSELEHEGLARTKRQVLRQVVLLTGDDVGGLALQLVGVEEFLVAFHF